MSDKKSTHSPKLGGSRYKGTSAPGLKREYRAFRDWILSRLEEGDTDSITAHSSRVIPHLIAIVSDPSRPDGLRSFAAVALGELRAEEGIPALGRVLREEVARRDATMLIMEIVEALEQINTPEAKAAIDNSGVRSW